MKIQHILSVWNLLWNIFREFYDHDNNQIVKTLTKNMLQPD